MEKKIAYVSSGEGYYHDPNHPDRGCAGTPYRDSFEEELLSQKADEDTLRLKALGLLEEAVIRDMPYKAGFLKKFGYRNIKVRGKIISLDSAVQTNPQNVNRMYNRSLNELRKIVKDPSIKSKLVDRLHSMP